MSGANVFIHESQFPHAVRRELIRSLQQRRINHKFHYESVKQAQKWLAVHEAHSPARTDRACLAAYDTAFRSVAREFGSRAVHVVGLGCGGGQKDVRLLELLADGKRRLSYTPCDVSVPLVLVARQRALKHVPDHTIHPIACDLVAAPDLESLLASGRGERRLITFFGMIPNFEPRVILPRLARLVRPDDTLLFSANLVPGPDFDQSMRRILPQYDNAETREWLLTLLLDLGVPRDALSLRFGIETVSGRVPLLRFVARGVFRRRCSLRIDSQTVVFTRGDAVQVFFSYRHTSATIERLLRASGLHVLDSWSAPSGEEGVFRCARSS